MPTMFSELYPLIRAVLGDSDTNLRLYEDHTLDAHLKLLSMEHDEWPLETVEAGDDVAEEESFADTVSRKELARIVLYCARSIINPTPNNTSYRTPILSVSRTGGAFEILVDIDRRLAALEAKKMIAYDSDIAALLGLGADRLSRSDYLPGVGFSP